MQKSSFSGRIVRVRFDHRGAPRSKCAWQRVTNSKSFVTADAFCKLTVSHQLDTSQVQSFVRTIIMQLLESISPILIGANAAHEMQPELGLSFHLQEKQSVKGLLEVLRHLQLCQLNEPNASLNYSRRKDTFCRILLVQEV